MELSDLEKKVLAEISKRNVGYIPRTSEITALFNLNERGLVRSAVDPRFGQIWHITDTGRVVLRQAQVLEEYASPDEPEHGLQDRLDSALNRIDALENALASLIEVADKNSEYLIGETQNILIREVQQAAKVLDNKNPPC